MFGLQKFRDQSRKDKQGVVAEVGFAQIAAIRRGLGERIRSTEAV
jgi:hypothetical protein